MQSSQNCHVFCSVLLWLVQSSAFHISYLLTTDRLTFIAKLPMDGGLPTFLYLYLFDRGLGEGGVEVKFLPYHT